MLEAGGRARWEVLWVRRYQCQQCGAWLTVVPRGIITKRVYFGGAIGFALALFGVERLSAARVRGRVSDAHQLGATAASGWAQLRRWIRDVRDSRIFPCVRGPPLEWTLRRIAERAATTLAAHAEASASAEPLVLQAWLGAQTAQAIAIER